MCAEVLWGREQRCLPAHINSWGQLLAPLGPEATGGVKKKPGEGPKQAGMHLCQECLTREWGKGWVRGGDSFNSCLEPEPASGAGGASGQLLTSFNVDSKIILTRETCCNPN